MDYYVDADDRTPCSTFDLDSVTSIHVDSGFGVFRILDNCFKHGVIYSPLGAVLYTHIGK